MAVVTSLSIVNQTLVFLGEEPLASYPDSTVNSNRLAVYYEDTKERELKKYEWNFAIFRETLTKSGTNPINEYSSQFPVPTDVLRILTVWPEGIKWKRENTSLGEMILTNSTTLDVRFLKNVDEDQMTKEFATVLAARLAILLSPIFTERDVAFQRATTWYTDAVEEARRMDGHESSHDQMRDLDVVQTRWSSNLSGLRYGWANS